MENSTPIQNSSSFTPEDFNKIQESMQPLITSLSEFYSKFQESFKPLIDSLPEYYDKLSESLQPFKDSINETYPKLLEISKNLIQFTPEDFNKLQKALKDLIPILQSISDNQGSDLDSLANYIESLENEVYLNSKEDSNSKSLTPQDKTNISKATDNLLNIIFQALYLITTVIQLLLQFNSYNSNPYIQQNIIIEQLNNTTILSPEENIEVTPDYIDNQSNKNENN